LIKTIYNFFNPQYIEPIYNECKKLKFYSLEEYKQKLDKKSNWPGQRTETLIRSNPFLYFYLSSILSNHNIYFENYREIFSACHVRYTEDEKKDFIHKDDADTVLIYLSQTNLESGTKFYADDHKSEILCSRFVQNSAVFFAKGISHGSFGNHGNTIDDGRMTINIFLYK
jgi:hypothetical protein|tara:strand:+ start:2088 stop:2597 length:510 start_codon:yes stop_codon:yes gene_type:complete